MAENRIEGAVKRIGRRATISIPRNTSSGFSNKKGTRCNASSFQKALTLWRILTTGFISRTTNTIQLFAASGSGSRMVPVLVRL